MDIRALSQRMEGLWQGLGDTYEGIGIFIGFITGAAAFVWILAAAVGSSGWVVGLVLGAVLGWFGSIVAFAISRYMWPVVLVVIVWLWTQIAA